MKYKLLKKIEGVDWEVNEILQLTDTTGGYYMSGRFMSNIDIHNLLLNGTIEKVEEKKWRAECGEYYYRIDTDSATFIVSCQDDNNADNCFDFEQGNYFRTREQAQEVADKIKQILKESHERN